jgi:hypothetical protein
LATAGFFELVELEVDRGALASPETALTSKINNKETVGFI